jgi:hypothetical protein
MKARTDGTIPGTHKFMDGLGYSISDSRVADQAVEMFRMLAPEWTFRREMYSDARWGVTRSYPAQTPRAGVTLYGAFLAVNWKHMRPTLRFLKELEDYREEVA